MNAMPSRRTFLQQVGVLGGCGLLAAYTPPLTGATIVKPSASAGLRRYGFILGNSGTTAIGSARARYLTPSYRIDESQPAVPSARSRAAPLAPRPPELEITFSLTAGQFLWQWINESIARGAAPRDGALDYIGLDDRIAERVIFSQAVPTAVRLSRLSTGARDVPEATLSLRAASTRLDAGGAAAPRPMKSSPLIPANFQLRIDGLDTRDVAEVTWPEISFPAPELPAGASRERDAATAVAARIGALKLGIIQRGPLAKNPFMNWLTDAARGSPSPRAGTIVLFDNARQRELFTCRLVDVLPLSVSMPEPEANWAMTAVELRVAGMEFMQRS